MLRHVSYNINTLRSARRLGVKWLQSVLKNDCADVIAVK